MIFFLRKVISFSATRAIFTVTVFLILLLLTVAAVGCSSDNVDVKITTPENTSEIGADGLTPLERGKVRRQIIDDAQNALNIWLKGDADNYQRAFTKSLLGKYKEQLDKLHKQGLDKARIHSNTHLEVVELTKKEAGLKYKFTDESYFFEIKSKKVKEKPKNEPSEMDIIVRKEEDRWKINAMIGKGKKTL